MLISLIIAGTFAATDSASMFFALYRARLNDQTFLPVNFSDLHVLYDREFNI